MVRFLLPGIAAAKLFGAQESEPTAARVLGLGEAERIAWINNFLRDGAIEPTEALTILAMSDSAVVIPLLEKEIEDILRSPAPKKLFTNASADPERVINSAREAIRYAGNAHSLEAASKLMKIDEPRFDDMVFRTLLRAGNLRNPFVVAYQGFGIGDPNVDKRIMVWAEMVLGLKDEFDRKEKRRWWAEAMVEKYKGVPSDAQLATDPIVSRLDPVKHLGIRDELLPLTVEAAQRPSKR